ncbi:hypothetical protein AVEN_91907-1, partial [Araneus ventricosus]
MGHPRSTQSSLERLGPPPYIVISPCLCIYLEYLKKFSPRLTNFLRREAPSSSEPPPPLCNAPLHVYDAEQVNQVASEPTSTITDKAGNNVSKNQTFSNPNFYQKIATHPFSPLIHTNDESNLQLVEKDAESLRVTFHNLNCIPDHVITLPVLPHSNPNLCEIFLQDFRFQSKEIPVSIITTSFTECIQSFFPNHFIIATDGSKSHCYTSIAGLSNIQQFSYRIHPLNSVFTAEVLAIYQALDELTVPEKDILILSDSYSALSSLKNITFHSPKVIQRLASKIHVRKSMNQNISLLWVPGHSGIFWNEKADSLAKQVTDSTSFIEWIASEDIISNLRKQSIQITHDNYRRSKYQAMIGNVPDIITISKWTKNRVQDRLIARIISKTIITPGEANDHPSPVDFLHRTRMLLAELMFAMCGNAHYEPDDDIILESTQIIPQTDEDCVVTDEPSWIAQKHMKIGMIWSSTVPLMWQATFQKNLFRKSTVNSANQIYASNAATATNIFLSFKEFANSKTGLQYPSQLF